MRKPVINMTAKPEMVQGARSAASWEAGRPRRTSPRRRRSTMATVPMDKAKPMKWRLSTTGKAHSGPFMALAQGLVVSHSKKESGSIISGEADPAASDSHSGPEDNRKQSHQFIPDRRDAAGTGEGDFANGSEGEDDGKKQRGHFNPEGFVIVELDGFGSEEEQTGGDHHGEAAEQPGAGVAPDTCHRLADEDEAEQTQVQYQNGAADHGETQEMEGFDDGKEPVRGANGLAKGSVLAPGKEREHLDHVISERIKDIRN